jgi:transposase
MVLVPACPSAGGAVSPRVEKRDDKVVADAEVRALEKRIRELERVLGNKTLENEILREAVKAAHEKQWISRFPSLPEKDMP